MITIHKADHVLPISSATIAAGAVAIDDGTIAAVGTAAEIAAAYPGAETIDHGRAAILPGFVNCHSHLEITGMRNMLDDVEHDFTSWLIKLTKLRAEMSPDEINEAAVIGAREGAAAGVTCFGDIGRMADAGVHALKTVGLRGIVFKETEFSPDNATADGDFKTLIEKFEELRAEETQLVKLGLSPHAPYTVGSRLFERLAQVSIMSGVPLSIHAAESSDEYELLTKGTGLLHEIHEKFGVEWHSPHSTTIEYLERLGVLAARPLLAHCITVSDSDIERIAANGARIAHCPKSNAKFGHGYAPFEKFLDAEISVGIGSDSVASNNLCDMLEEARFAVLAARNREGSMRFITPKEALHAITLGGAAALGMDDSIGSLEPGKAADLAIVSLDHAAQQPVGDIHSALVFSSSGRDVKMTMVAGNVVFQAQK
jgi:cytosine/adenosine deaminase-related metal-dependent hydrolase